MSAVEKLQFENAYQQVLINLATKFINVPIDRMDEAITGAIRQVVEFLGATRATINEFSADDASFVPLYYWQNFDVGELPPRIDFPNSSEIRSVLERDEHVLVKDRDALPPESSTRLVMGMVGIRAVVAVPIFRDGVLFGFVSTGWQEATDIRPETTQLLRVLAEIFLNVLERTTNEARIRKLNEDLEKRVEERTQELRLANDQLQNEVRERQQVEATLRLSEERYRITSGLISDYAFVFGVEPDHTLKLEWITLDSYTRVTGYTVEDIETTPYRRYHPDDEDLAREDVKQVLRGESIEREYRLITKSGDVRRVFMRRYPVWDPDQHRVVRFYGVAQDITARKATEDALRMSEERYRIIGELISDFAFLYRSELDGTLTLEWLTEESYERVTGYLLTAVAPPFRLYHPDDEERARQDIALTLRGHRAEGEYRIHTREGVERWLYIRRYPIWDAGHERVERFYGVAQDITERKHMEDALRISEERYRMITELISDYAFLYRVDLYGKIQPEWMTQDSYKRLTGYDPGYTEGTFRLYHPEDAARAEQDVQLTMQGAFTENEYRIVTRSGDVRWIYMRRYPVWNAARDQVEAYYGVAQNITRRKEAEEALRLSEERYRRITELISDYAFLYRSDGSDMLKPVWITEDSFYRLTGFTPEQGGGAYQLYHPDDVERARLDVERTLAGEAVESEYRIMTGSGDTRWIYMRRYPVWNKAHDAVEALYGVAQDVTGRKLIEMEEREQRTLVEALLDTAQALNSTFDLEEMLRRILTNIDRVVPHDVSTVLLIKDGEAYIVAAREASTVGQQKAIRDFRLRLTTTPNLTEVIHSRRSLIIDDTQTYPGWLRVPGTTWIRSNVCIPIQQSSEIIGFLTCDSGLPGFFTPKMLKGLEAFAHQIALAMTSARLYEEGKELAILAERQRLARDLHDAVTQTMFSASMIAETLPRLQPEQMRRGLMQLQQLTRGAVAEMRALLLELRPEALEGMALARLVGQLADAFSGQTGIVPVFETAGERPLPQDVKIMLYRIAQEAFNNISKHARASAVNVSLTFHPVVKLTIEDNGRGFIPEQIKSGSLGLKIMRERAEQGAARFMVESVPGKRTLITVEWTEPDA